ncbi:MAG TPA: hypothetical protein VEJ39_08355 [Candidatus Acidoferrales bacterium]|nr:hypothetical protein [Candidatus Acidoferrales bacterium]
MRFVRIIGAIVLILLCGTPEGAIQYQNPNPTQNPSQNPAAGGKELPPCAGTVGPAAGTPPRTHLGDIPTPDAPDCNGPQAGTKRAVNMAQVKMESMELQKLVDGLPDELTKVQNGVLPADLVLNLKKIEKLSKHIRSEID